MHIFILLNFGSKLSVKFLKRIAEKKSEKLTLKRYINYCRATAEIYKYIYKKAS